MQILNLSERAGLAPMLPRAYMTMSIGAALVSALRVASYYRRRAFTVAEQLEQFDSLEWAWLLSGIYDISFGHWDEAEQAFDKVSTIAGRLNDYYRLTQSISCHSWIYYHRDSVERARSLADELCQLGMRQNLDMALTYGLYHCGACYIRQGEPAAAVRVLEECLPLYERHADHLTQSITYSLLALAQLRHGEHLLAASSAGTAQQLLTRLETPVFASGEAYIALAEVRLALWELQQGTAQRASQALQREAHGACRALRRFARTFPIARPRASLLEGRRAWLAGNSRRALGLWQRSLTQSEALGMPYDQALAHHALGLHGAQSERQHHLERAAAIFTQYGAAADAAHVQALLAPARR